MDPDLRNRIQGVYERTWCEVVGIAKNPSQIAAEAVYQAGYAEALRNVHRMADEMGYLDADQIKDHAAAHGIDLDDTP